MSIKEFSNQVTDYSHHIKMMIQKGVTETWVLPKFHALNEVLQKAGVSSFSEYLENIINEFKPNKIHVIGGKKNGTGVLNPKDFYLEVDSSHKAIDPPQKPMVEQKNDFDNLSGTDLMNQPAKNSPVMAEMYRFQYDHATRELNKALSELEKYKTKFEALQEKHTDLKREFDTQEAKFDLERQKAAFDQNNTLVAVAKEFRPELNGLMGFIGEKMAGKNAAANQNALAGNNEKSLKAYAIAHLDEFDFTNLKWGFEIFIRAFNLSAEQKNEVMENLRALTPQMTEPLKEVFETYTEK